jgi:hypothetical protein
MRYRTKLAAAALCVLAAAPVRAQVANLPPSQGATPNWSFSVAPYVWLPTISSDAQIARPRGGTINTSVSAGFGDYISDVNLAAMAGAAARYDRFSIMTDITYLNASLTNNDNHLSSTNFGSGPVDVPRAIQTGTGTLMNTTIWSLAGAYTVLQGDWGNIDVLAGMRMLAVDSKTNYSLTTDILGRDGTVGLSRTGSVSINKTYFNGVGGVTGRINIPNSKFYVPFYFDAGGGAIPLTWQAYGGLGYIATNWAEISAGYRYLTFENNGGNGVQNISLSGFILATNIRF